MKDCGCEIPAPLYQGGILPKLMFKYSPEPMPSKGLCFCLAWNEEYNYMCALQSEGDGHWRIRPYASGAFAPEVLHRWLSAFSESLLDGDSVTWQPSAAELRAAESLVVEWALGE